MTIILVNCLYVPFDIRVGALRSMTGKLLNEVAVRTCDEVNAIAESSDRSNKPPIPTAIVFTPAVVSDTAAFMTSSVDFPAVITSRIRVRPAASPTNRDFWHSKRAAPTLQLPPVKVRLETSASTSFIEVYLSNPNTT